MLFSIDFTKFLDVKSPEGCLQTGKKSNYQSIGVDLYMPKPTLAFVDMILDSNKNSSLHYIKKNKIDENILDEFRIVETLSTELIQYKDGKYIISSNIQIPTGIGLLIPINYFVSIKSRSSNFKYKYSSIIGTIDEDYTYSMGVQLFLLNNKPISIEVDERFSQIILQKGEKIATLNEIPLNNWNNMSEVIERRESRSGGFGSTGKK